MTEKLYYQDAYLKEFSAVITGVRAEGDHILLAFDRTAFYPEGGGQPSDLGTIRFKEDGEEFHVSDVQEEQEEIWHFLNSQELPEPLIGQKVFGKIDWERRFDHMQQHSGEHIVSGMICREFHCDNVGFHLGEEDVTIDYNTRISMEDILRIEDAANRYLWENHPLEELWPSPEELKKIEYRSKKELEGKVRLTRFPGADICACCGTHVKTSAEVGLVKFTAAHGFHGGTRLTLYCGKRAFDFLRMNHQANKETAVLLSTKEERTPEIVKKQLEDLYELKNRFNQMQDSYFRMWAESYRGAETVLIVTDQLNPEEGRKLSDLIADTASGLCAVFTGTDGKYRYSIMKRNEDISSFIKSMNQALSGKGGGRNGFAQGTAEASEKEIMAFFGECFERTTLATGDEITNV